MADRHTRQSICEYWACAQRSNLVSRNWNQTNDWVPTKILVRWKPLVLELMYQWREISRRTKPVKAQHCSHFLFLKCSQNWRVNFQSPLPLFHNSMFPGFRFHTCVTHVAADVGNFSHFFAITVRQMWTLKQFINVAFDVEPSETRKKDSMSRWDWFVTATLRVSNTRMWICKIKVKKKMAEVAACMLARST